MSEPNSYTNISSDGNVTTYDVHGVRIKELCGDLRMVHKILRINSMVANEKSKLPKKMRVRHVAFNFVREDTSESIPIPVQHVVEFVKHIEKDDLEQFIEHLLLQIPKD